jgi:hypothetical protein
MRPSLRRAASDRGRPCGFPRPASWLDAAPPRPADTRGAAPRRPTAGSCQYGYLDREVGTGWDIAAISDKAWDYQGSCGKCKEVRRPGRRRLCLAAAAREGGREP